MGFYARTVFFVFLHRASLEGAFESARRCRGEDCDELRIVSRERERVRACLVIAGRALVEYYGERVMKE